MRFIHRSRLVVPLVVATTAQAAPAPRQIQDIGSLPGVASTASAISADGLVAAGAAISPGNGATGAWVWTEEDGYRLLSGQGAVLTAAFYVSADGRIVVGQSELSAGSGRQLALWSAATGIRLDVSDPAIRSIEPLGVNGDGSSVVGALQTLSGTRQAFQWRTLGGFRNLQDLGGTRSVARAISRDGTIVVGEAEDPTGLQIAVRWESDGSIDLVPGLPSTASSSRATHVSRDGLFIAGTVQDASAPTRVFHHDGTTGITRFGAMAGLAEPLLLIDMSDDGSTLLLTRGAEQVLLWRPRSGAAVALSDAGSFRVGSLSEAGDVVVGTYLDPVTGDSSAARWEAATGVVQLPGLGGEASAFRISADGATILGEAEFESTLPHPAIWRDSGEIGGDFCEPVVPNSSGARGRLAATGNNSIQSPDLVLRATQLPVGAASFVLVSRTAVPPSTVMGSLGQLCLGGEIGRLIGPGQIQIADPTGSWSLPIDPNRLPLPSGGTTAALFGEAWSFQAWHRDVLVGPLATSNFTNAVTVRFY